MKKSILIVLAVIAGAGIGWAGGLGGAELLVAEVLGAALQVWISG